MPSQSLSRAEVEAAFREMGEILVRRRVTAEIAVYGGAAILLQFAATFRTADVDATVEAGDHGAVMEAAREVAERHGWLRSWFSEAVANYVGTGGTALHGTYPSEARPGLRVLVAKPDYLLAMKLRALRPGSRDESDAAMLAGVCGIASLEDCLGLLRTYFPREPADARRVAIIAHFVESLNAPGRDNAG